MMPETIFCPFCNAALLPTQLTHADLGKISCPRCGEPLPSHLLLELPDLPVLSPTPVSPNRNWTNRKIGIGIFAGMILMAIGGLTLALVTMEGRRKNDYGVKRGITIPATVQPPAELRGLGFLPNEVNIVLAVQVAELSKDAAGQKLLEAPSPALLDLLLGTIEKWTKLKVEDVDAVVLGTEIKDKLPQLTMIVTTRKSFEAATLAKALYPKLSTLSRGHPLYRFKLEPGEAMLWLPEPRTIILLFRLDALKMEDLNAIPLPPRHGSDAPPAPIQEVLSQRVNKQSLAWAAGNLDHPDLLKELQAFAPLPARGMQFLSQIEAFGLSLYAQDGLALDGYFRANTEKTTPLVQIQLEEWHPKNVKSYKVVADPAGRWLSMQMRGDSQAFREALSR